MSELVKTWTEWLFSSRFSYMDETQRQQTLLWLIDVRDKIIERAKLQPGETVIDIGSGTGLLAFGAHMALEGKGKVIVSDAFADCIEACQKIAEKAGIEGNMGFLQSDAADIKLPDASVDVVMMRSVLVHILNKAPAVREFFRILKPGGRISIFEPIIGRNTRYYELVDPATFPNYEKIKQVEQTLASELSDPLTNFDEHTLERDFKEAGFVNVDPKIEITSSTYEVREEMIEPWFNTPPSPGKPTLKQQFMDFMPMGSVIEVIENIKKDLTGKEITINSPVLYLYAEKG